MPSTRNDELSGLASDSLRDLRESRRALRSFAEAEASQDCSGWGGLSEGIPGPMLARRGRAQQAGPSAAIRVGEIGRKNDDSSGVGHLQSPAAEILHGRIILCP